MLEKLQGCSSRVERAAESGEIEWRLQSCGDSGWTHRGKPRAPNGWL